MEGRPSIADDRALEEHRRALVGLGYRMLGSFAEAEDVAQEALLRLHRAEPPPTHPRAWLAQVATRLCLDRLGAARVRREAYVGPWLPDFLVGDADPAADAETAESVSLALLVVLETLTPAERASFILHDAFGYSYQELAEALGRSEAACRQLVSRARRHVQARRPRFQADRDEQLRVTQAFLAAAGAGEMEPLMALLADDVVLRADSGGKRPSPRRPLHGPADVARFLLGLQRKYAAGASFEPLWVNGGPGLLARMDGEADSLIAVDVAEGRVTAVHILREPDKLRAALARARA
jgi:RNA polymerase sigma-70 factor (ECF subfamily)